MTTPLPGLVSVVMPAYNHEPYVEAAVRSVWAQTYGTVELVALNDGSPDGTGGVLDRLAAESPIPMRVVHKPNEGLCRTLNRGLAMVRGEFVVIAASDDVMRPGKLEREVACLRQHGPEVAYAYGDMLAVDDEGRPLRVLSVRPKRGNAFHSLVADRSAAYVQCGTFRRGAVAALGGFDEALGFEDVDFMLRLTAQFQTVYAGGVSVEYRDVEGSLATTLFRRVDDFLAIREKHRGAPAVRALGPFAERRVDGYTHTRIASVKYMGGDVAGARAHAVRSIRSWPLDRRPWAVLALGTLPRVWSLALLDVRRRLRYQA